MVHMIYSTSSGVPMVSHTSAIIGVIDDSLGREALDSGSDKM